MKELQTKDQTKESKKPYVSEILDYEKDIKPYQVIQILAGVGSGKNVFIEKLAEEHKTLIITSRRAKVDQVLDRKKEENYIRSISYDPRLKGLLEVANNYHNPFEKFLEEHYDDMCKLAEQYGYKAQSIKQKTSICTNAMVEYYYLDIYNKEDEYSEIENLYDIIVIDEFHSLVTDASYQSAPFFVNILIRKIIDKFIKNAEMRCKHLIMMSATPEPISKLYENSLAGFHREYDLRDICHSVYPNNVKFIEFTNAKYLLYDFVKKKNKKVLYFSNHISEMMKYLEGTSIEKSKIGFSYSDKTRRDSLSEEERKRMKKLEDEIEKNSTLPEGIQMLLCTSRYKEGIDLRGKFDVVFIESHCESDVLQMTGRCRDGIESLYIVVDSKGYKTKRDYLLDSFDSEEDKNICDMLNKMLEDHKKDEKKVFELFIQRIEKKHSFIKYNPTNGVFEYYRLRELSNDYYRSQHEIWRNCKNRYKDIVSMWFKNSTVIEYEKHKDWNIEKKEENKIRKTELLKKFFDANYECGIVYSQERMKPLYEYLEMYWKAKSLNPVLKRIGIRKKQYGKFKTEHIFVRLEDNGKND